MRKYFQVQDYYGNMKARVSIFNLILRAYNMVGAPQESEEDQWKEDYVEAVQEIFQEEVPLS